MGLRKVSKSKKELESYQIRCAEAEKAIEACSAAFELIPIWALERGQNWLPSETAIHLLKVAKDSVRDFAAAHWRGVNGN
jgi:hypothetical protein